MTEQEAEKLDRLIQEAQDLGREVEQLATASGTQFVSLAVTARQNRRRIWAVAVGGGLLTAVVVAMVFLVIGMQSNTERIDGVTRRLDVSQTATRQKVLCPLYQILKDTGSPEARAAAPDKKLYDHNYKVINDGYNELKCSQVKGKTP